MGQSSRRFNFDEFDRLCAEALLEDQRMVEEDEAWAEYERWIDGDPRPGEIGGVVCRPIFGERSDSPASPLEPLPDPPEAA